MTWTFQPEAPLSLGTMDCIDVRRIIAGQHGLNLGEMRALHATLATWLSPLQWVRDSANRQAAHEGPCAALALVDNIEGMTHQTGLEDAVNALLDQIREAEGVTSGAVHLSAFFPTAAEMRERAA
jgi:hypothetical protein